VWLLDFPGVGLMEKRSKTQPRETSGTPIKGVIMFNSGMVSGNPRGCQAPGLTTGAVINHRRSLLWGYGGVNISPTAVPAPEEDDIDFDFVIDFLKSDEDFEDNDFEDFIEYLDNQWW